MELDKTIRLAAFTAKNLIWEAMTYRNTIRLLVDYTKFITCYAWAVYCESAVFVVCFHNTIVID